MRSLRGIGYPASQGRRAAVAAVVLLLACACATAAVPDVPASARPGPVVQEGVRSLDPLSERERQTAVRLATQDERVRRLIAGREFDVGYTELFVTKERVAPEPDSPERAPSVPRLAEVLIAVFDREFLGVRAVVDLESGAVREVGSYSPLTGRGQDMREGARFTVPFTSRERAIALELALQNPELRAMLGPQADAYEADGLPVTSVIPDVCQSGRCMEMTFRRGDTYLTSTIIVDIPARTARFRRGPQ